MVALLLVTATTVVGPQSPATVIDTAALRARAAFLVSDELTGRANGTAGQRVAAAYIISELTRMGLRGAGADGRVEQPVALSRIRLDAGTTKLVVGSQPAVTTFTLGEFTLRGSQRSAYRSVAGAAVFLGPVGSVPAMLAKGLDVRGRIVVVTSGGGGPEQALSAVQGAHAAALLYVSPSAERYRQTAVMADAIFQFGIDADASGPAGFRLPFIMAGPSVARRLGIGSKDTLPLTRARPLTDSLRMDVAYRTEAVRAANLVARIDGTDPGRREETVVLQAHYDHMDIGSTVKGDSIYNGFMDDATGVSAVLAAAEALRDSARAGHLPRSVLLLLTVAEESGSLGSS